MDIETYKKIGEIIRIIRMANQVEEMAALHVEKLLAQCLEIRGMKPGETMEIQLPESTQKENPEKLEVSRTDDDRVIMVLYEKETKIKEIPVSKIGTIEKTMQIFNVLTNQILENMSPEIKKAMDEVQKEAVDKSQTDKDLHD